MPSSIEGFPEEIVRPEGIPLAKSAFALYLLGHCQFNPSYDRFRGLDRNGKDSNLTLSYQAIKAALVDSVKSLRMSD